MKRRSGDFGSLRTNGKKVVAKERVRTARDQSVGYRKDLFEGCYRPGCGLSRLHHERGPLLPDHAFKPGPDS